MDEKNGWDIWTRLVWTGKNFDVKKIATKDEKQNIHSKKFWKSRESDTMKHH